MFFKPTVKEPEPEPEPEMEISGPFGVLHNTHIGVDPDTGKMEMWGKQVGFFFPFVFCALVLG